MAIPLKAELDPARMPGHWLLARLGKKVLRPGGQELTRALLAQVDFTDKKVVEFAPGLGFTADLILAHQVADYTGIEADREAARLSGQVIGNRGRVVRARAQKTGLAATAADVVLGEAMLSMQGDSHKLAIIKEANRILKAGGIYIIHELGLTPDSLAKSKKDEIQHELTRLIHVNARPLTFLEWQQLLYQGGFKVIYSTGSKMRLLELNRLIADEGWAGVAKIIKNLLLQRGARRRVFAMRRGFRRYRHELCAVGIIACKL